MGLEKGHTNNPNGRPKGTPNKVTSKVKELIQNFIDENFDLIKEDFKNLEPRDRIKYYLDLIEYVVPKLSRAGTEAVDDKKNTYIFNVTPEQKKVIDEIS